MWCRWVGGFRFVVVGLVGGCLFDESDEVRERKRGRGKKE